MIYNKDTNRTDTEFTASLGVHYDELKWLYSELYGNDAQAFEQLCDILYSYYYKRNASLKALDKERKANPKWYHGSNIVGMMLYADNFAGTLKGVAEKIDYFKECNVNYLHLMPLLKSPKENSDGGYAVSDFGEVRPDLGTMQDLQALTALCHKNGISCCLDLVMNHTSEEHIWAKRARAGDVSAQNRYFFYDSWDIPHEYEKSVPEVFPTSAPGNFTKLDDCGKIVMTTFYPYQWDLNYANPQVFNDMAANMLNLANNGIDVIRLDAVPYIWKQLGTSCRNLPQVHTLVRMFRMITEIVCPSVLLLGEVVMEPAKVVPYFGTKDKPECHMLYNVTTMACIWNTIATRDTRLLKHQAELNASLPKEYVFLNYLRCHDDIGWGLDYPWLSQFGQEQIPHKKFLNDYFTGKFKGSVSRGELYNDDPTLGDARLCGTTASLCGIEAAVFAGDKQAVKTAVDADIMLHAYMFTQSGIPVIYSGDEVGAFNDYMYHADINKKFDSRYLHRGKFNWKLAESRKNPQTYQGKLFSALLKLEKLRRENKVFSSEASFNTINTGTTNVLGIRRQYGDKELIAYFNFCESSRTITFSGATEYTDLYTGKKADGESITLSPYGFAWLLI